MTKNLLEKFDMGVNLDGLIILLAEHLYSDPNVFVRELVQNAHDAIRKRQAEDSDVAGKIEISANKQDRTITCFDNGIGMSKEEIKQHLATIGDSETRLRKMSREDTDLSSNLIGQFGIGLLSSFIVAKKVVVRTKKIHTNSSFEWHNSGSLNCDLYEDQLTHFGTEIIVHLKDGFEYLLEEENLAAIIKKYCDFIPFPILVNGQGAINNFDAPIYKTHWNNDDEKLTQYSLFINRKFNYDDLPLDIIPFNINGECTAKGALFISARNMPNDSTGIIDIFVRRMFIKESDTSLLPEWAKFVRGIIDSPDLQPTASRDSVKINHPSFEFLKKELGLLIIDRLAELARNNPGKFEKINQWHHYHLKGMACKHKEFFTAVKDLLLFETSGGKMSLPSYFLKNERIQEYDNKKPIYYFPIRQASALFNGLAKENDLTVINAGGAFDEQFLELYSESENNDTVLINLEGSDNPVIFRRLTLADEKDYGNLCIKMQQVLNADNRIKVEIRVRSFEPSRLAAVIVNDKDYKRNKKLEELASLQTMFGSATAIVDEFLKTERPQTLYLTINHRNELIKQMPSLAKVNDDMLSPVCIGLFNLAVLYSHSSVIEYNSNIIYDQFLSLFKKLIDFQEKSNEKQLLIEEHRTQITTLKNDIDKLHNKRHEEEWWNASPKKEYDHVILFAIMPFSGYQPFFEAIKKTFECYPFYFQIIRADEKTYSQRMMDNIIEHYKRADGFIIEISDLNANVFYELGALSPFEKKRLILNFRKKTAKELPADLQGVLYNSYQLDDKSTEDIAKEIRLHFFENGSYKNEMLVHLINSRKKCYLSRNVLKTDTVINFKDTEIDSILSHYKCIEDLLNESSSSIFEKTMLKETTINLLKENLREAAKLK